MLIVWTFGTLEGLLLRNHIGGLDSVLLSKGCLRLSVSYDDENDLAELTFDITVNDSMFMEEA